MKRIMAAILIALLAVGLLPTVSLVAKAQETQSGVEVITYVASPNGQVKFFVNLTYLRNTLGWVGSDVEIYVSGDGQAVINPNDVKIAPPQGRFYVAEVEYVAGTLLLPGADILKELAIAGGTYDAASNTGFIYIKVTDGSNVAVSKRILIVFNPDDYIVVKGTKLAYPYGPLDTTDTFCFKINLTQINSRLPSYKQINFSTTENITYKVELKFVSGAAAPFKAFVANITNSTVVGGPLSDNFNVDTVTAYDAFFRFNGTLKDFALPANGNIETENINGIEVTGVVFNQIFNIYVNDTTNLTGSVLLVENNVEDMVIPTGYVIANLTLSLGFAQTVTIYPSIEYLGYVENASTVPGQLNPNDQVQLYLRHFPANGVIYVTIWRYDEGTFTPLLTDINVTALTGKITDANGTANITLTLPEATYGGYPYAFTAKVEGLVGLPAVNVTTESIVLPPIIPYVEAYAAQADGTFRWPAGGPTAWGDYLLVKGHGFLQEPVNIVAISESTGAELFDLAELVSYGAANVTVFGNGTFIAIVKIPNETGINQSFYVLGKGATPSDNGRSVASFYFHLGDALVQKVYVNPVPVIKNATYGYISLGLDPAYPYPASWEDLANREFTLEVIGLDPVNFAKVSVNITNDVINLVLDNLVNLTPVNGYLKIDEVQVPVVPMGAYNITVYNSTSPGVKVVTDPASEIYVRPTAAFIDPLKGDYTKIVSIMAILDLNVTGYGWPANVLMQWDIVELEMLGFANFTIVRFTSPTTTEDVYTNSLGAFNGTIRLSLFISNIGTYHIRIHPKDQVNVSDTLTVAIGEMPKLIVNVETAKTKVTGDVVDVWVQVLFSTGELANNTQIIEVTVSVYAYEGGEKVPLVAGAAATYMGEGLWHYAFTIDPEYKGKDLVVVVEAKGRYLPYLPIQSGYDIAAITVAGGLEDQITNVQTGLEQLANAIADLSDQVSQVAATLDQIQAALGNIQNTLGDINTGIANANDKLDQIITSLNDLSNMVDTLSSKLDQTANDLKASLDQFKADVQQAVQPASSTAKTWGIINAVLILIIGVAIIAALLRSKP